MVYGSGSEYQDQIWFLQEHFMFLQAMIVSVSHKALWGIELFNVL